MTEGSDAVLVLNHLRLAFRMAVILLPVMFLFGAFAGWFLAQWSQTPLGAAIGAGIVSLFGAWVTITYYRTRGLCTYVRSNTPTM